MDSSGNQIGTISEDSGLLAIVRRFVPFADIFVPQEFILSAGGNPVTFTQSGGIRGTLVNKWFVKNIQSSGLDPRLILAATMLLIAIEGKQGAGWLRVFDCGSVGENLDEFILIFLIAESR